MVMFFAFLPDDRGLFFQSSRAIRKFR